MTWLPQIPRPRLPVGSALPDGWLNAAALVLGFILLLAYAVVRVRSADSHVLVPEHGAQWIRLDEPTLLGKRPMEPRIAVFRKRIVPQRSISGVELSYRAMKHATLYLDRVKLQEDSRTVLGWNCTRTIHIQGLDAGRSYELLFVVQSRDSHVALLAYCDELGVRTGADWEVSTGDRVWVSAMPADAPHPPEIASLFPPTYSALWHSASYLVPLFLLVAGLAWIHERKGSAAVRASTVRWVLLAAFAALAVNNLVKLPVYRGMDYPDHLEYIRFIASGKGLPIAGQGWQTFQAPLYYLVSAPLLRLFQGFGGELPERALRIVPWLCGLAQVELCYRAMRAVHPGKDGLQIIGLLLSALIPMNLYISQTIGNEPLGAVFSSLALLMVLVRIQAGTPLLTPRFGFQLGLVLGLALLTKTSHFLTALLLSGYCLAWGIGEGSTSSRVRIRTAVPFLATFAGTLLLVAGWYYARNWWHLGSLFVGGWDPRFGVPWWQDHGYIPTAFLHSFGRALIHPVYAQTSGFLNGLYSTFWTDGTICSVIHPQFIPPWNFNLMLGGVLLSLAPCGLMIAGAVSSFRSRATRLSVTCILVFIAAIFCLHLGSLPAYSTLKSTYMLGLLPCFGILGAAGFDALPDRPFVRSAATGLLVTWAITSFFGFWIL